MNKSHCISRPPSTLNRNYVDMLWEKRNKISHPVNFSQQLRHFLHQLDLSCKNDLTKKRESGLLTYLLAGGEMAKAFGSRTFVMSYRVKARLSLAPPSRVRGFQTNVPTSGVERVKSAVKGILK